MLPSNGKSRRHKIYSCLAQPNPYTPHHGDWTVAELCLSLGEGVKNAKFISSVVARECAKDTANIVKSQRRVCGVTKRLVSAYCCVESHRAQSATSDVQYDFDA